MTPAVWLVEQRLQSNDWTGDQFVKQYPSTKFPKWLRLLVPRLLNNVTPENKGTYALRFDTAVQNVVTFPPQTKNQFLIFCINSALESAKPMAESKPYWPAVLKACNEVISCLQDPNVSKECLKAAHAANAAANAANAAAYAAANAAYAAANAAARAAINEKLFDHLLVLLKE